jgi:hypothetical protein
VVIVRVSSRSWVSVVVAIWAVALFFLKFLSLWSGKGLWVYSWGRRLKRGA